MKPILLRTPWFFVYGYTTALAVGILAGLAFTAWRERRYAPPEWLDLWLTVTVTAVFGGRLGFLAANVGYFQERPSELWQIWRGGFNYHAALLAGLLGVWIFCRWRNRPFSNTLHMLAPAWVLAGGFGWLACWLEGCAYGAPAAHTGAAGWLVAELPDAFGVFAMRYRTQALGMIWHALLFVLIWRRTAGFWWALLAVSLGHGLIGLLRGDEAVYLAGLRLDLWLNLLLVLIAALLLKYGPDKELEIDNW